MAKFRDIVRLLALAFFLIAAAALPRPAEAHDGHGHGVVAATQSMIESASVSPSSAQNLQQVSTPGVADYRSQPTDSACGGLCCGSGVSCCSPAITPEQISLRAPTRGGQRVLFPDLPFAAGIQPGALPKPPRSFV